MYLEIDQQCKEYEEERYKCRMRKGFRSLLESLNHHKCQDDLLLKKKNLMLLQYVNRELPDIQAGFRKAKGTRDQIANIHWIIKKARGFEKNIYFYFIDYAKSFD